jgi:hypothetical protein
LYTFKNFTTMKKLILILISCLIFVHVNAQTAKAKNYLPKDYWKRIKPIPLNAIEPINNNRGFSETNTNPSESKKGNTIKLLSATETYIGETSYFLQTNGSISNRCIVHSDKTISATWSFAPIGSTTGWPLRGTGYNYFNGANWGPSPTTRIQGHRSGFPNIVVTASGKEMDISHSSTGMSLTLRPTKGNGVWVDSLNSLGAISSDSWPKAISGGANGETVHALWLDNTNINANGHSLLYSRSLDGGATWPILRSIIPLIDSTNYDGFGGDSYSIDTKGDTVVIAIGFFTTDLILLKSTDNGTSWAKIVIQSFPIPHYYSSGQTFGFAYSTADPHVMLDNNGLTHVFWSNVLLTDTSGFVSYFPNANDGLLYWNENHPIGAIDTIAFAEDKNGNGILDLPTSGIPLGCGSMGNYRGSITQMPSSAVDSANNIFVSYQSYCENCDTTAYNYGHKHVYTIILPNGGATWSNPLDADISVDFLNQENVYGCLAKRANGTINLIYQRSAGHPQNPCSPVSWAEAYQTVHLKIDYSSILGSPWTFPMGNVSIKQKENISLLLEAYPNPCANEVTLSFDLYKSTKASVEIKNLLGENFFYTDLGKLDLGKHSVKINTQLLVDGIYFYTLKTEYQIQNAKFVVSH